MCMYVFVFALLVVLYKNEREVRKGGASSERGLCHKHAMRKKSRGGGRASSPPTAKKNSLNLLSQVNELVERI